MSERLTVGIPAYNEAKTIGRTLESILDQRLLEDTSVDIVVCVRKGVDQTEDIVVGLAQQHQEVRLVTTDIHGKAHGWNLLREAAQSTSDTFIFCDADVVLDPYAINALNVALKTDSKIKLVGAHLIMVTEGSRGLMKIINPVLGKAPPKGTLNGRLYALRKEAIDAVGNIPPWTINEDEYLSLKIQQLFGQDAFKVNMQARAYYTPPLTLQDYFQYRFRCEVGHAQLKKTEKFDFKPYSTFRGRGSYLRNLSLREKMVLPVLAAINFWCKVAAGDAYEWGDVKRIEAIESTKKVAERS